MKTRSMEERISYRLFFMGLVGLVLTAALCIFVFHKAFSKQVWLDMKSEAAEISAAYPYLPDTQNLSAFAVQGLRVTLIAPSGEVVYDSAVQQELENHLSRPEIQSALSTGEGQSQRNSETMGYRTYYYALLLADGNILRIAQDAEGIWSIYDEALPAVLLSCVLIMGLSVCLSWLLTKSLIAPILKLADDLDHIQSNVPYPELQPFADAIHSDRLLRENNEKMRQEFTANVSHELKTPLTSISGYAELIETGIAKPTDVCSFGAKIHAEAVRMITLVNDIIQLSQLDTFAAANTNNPAFECVDLFDLAKECADQQKLNAQRAFVTLNYMGEHVTVIGSRSLLTEVFQNLCDNAIRYNCPGGKVQLLTGRTRDGKAFLTVKDTGIGIPHEVQGRVFERFYRVDKSRSKATGGTGLGLAIVKHIVLIHGAKLHLESTVGEGTTITIAFETAPPKR